MVRRAYEWRLEQSLLDDFSPLMISEIQKQKADRVRVHDSGDFYSIAYMRKWIEIAKRLPNVEFYAYTKAVAWAKSLQWPANWTLIFSFGGAQDSLIDTEHDRHSKVFGAVDELKASGYADAHKQDDVAVGPNPRIGLVYHGLPSRSAVLV
jgi:hypothetical protein